MRVKKKKKRHCPNIEIKIQSFDRMHSNLDFLLLLHQDKHFIFYHLSFTGRNGLKNTVSVKT